MKKTKKKIEKIGKDIKKNMQKKLNKEIENVMLYVRKISNRENPYLQVG